MAHHDIRASDRIRPPRKTRILRGLALALVLVAVAWTALWFGIAAYAERRFESLTAELAGAGQADVACGRHGMHGFPFTFRFVCDEDVMVETERADVALASVAARASVFSPSTVTANLEGPANVALAPGRALRADWSHAEAAASDLFGRRRFAVDIETLDLDVAGTRIKAAAYEADLTPEGPDLQIDAAATNVAITLPGRGETMVPAMQAALQLEGLHRRLIQLGRPFDTRNGLKGTIERLRLDAPSVGGGEGRLFVSGPFEISPEGRLSGRFTIAVRDPNALATLAADFVPDPQAIAGALTALATLGERREIDGTQMRALELEAVDGKLPLGFVTLDIPPIWQRPPDG